MPLGTYHLPRYIEEGQTTPWDAEVNRRLLEKMTMDGIQRLYPPEQLEEATARARMELETIEKCGFVDYFLIVQDFTRFARRKESPSAPVVDLPLAPSSPTRPASPKSSRCGTICYSSAFSTPPVSRCPISTWILRMRAGVRSSSMCASGTVNPQWPRWRPSAGWRPSKLSVTWDERLACCPKTQT